MIENTRKLLRWNRRKKRSRRTFSLLEVVIALVILILASGVIGVRVGRALEERRFEGAVGRLRAELEAMRRLAVNMQADWVVVLNKRGRAFSLKKECAEFDRLVIEEWEAPCKIFLDGREKLEIAFRFSATGWVFPKGVVAFERGTQRIEWDLAKMFFQEEAS